MTTIARIQQGRSLTLVEVGPRDGLQNQHQIVPTADKIAFIDMLSEANCPVIEVGAFVHPKSIPQLADTAAVFAGITRRAGIRYSALVPNLVGLERAMAAGVDEISVFVGSSETFNLRNVSASIDESIRTYEAVSRDARSAGIRVRAYLSTAFGCPYEGYVRPEVVRRLTKRLLEIGAFEVALSDTIGVATPAQVEQVLEEVLTFVPRADQIALHLHNTRGAALANVLAAFQFGISTFDSSAAGLGGCPYASGATGNLASEELLYMLDGLGVNTGVSLDRLVASAAFIASCVGKRYLFPPRTAA